MTAWIILAAIRRRWHVAVLGLLLTALALGWAASIGGVYYSQVYVVMLAPVTADAPNAYQYIGRSLVGAAGIVVRQVDPRAMDPGPVSPKVTIADMGITDGYRLRVPNYGGQWAYNFERPEMSVEAVGSSPQVVRARLAQVVSRIQAVLAQDQADIRAPHSQAISTTLNPPDPPVYYVHGSRPRAVGGILALGIGFTLAGVVVFERRSLRRSARHHSVSAYDAWVPDGTGLGVTAGAR